MDFRTVSLDPVREAAGRRLLEIMDQVGFRALGAGWLWEQQSGTWWYALVTPMIDSKGPLWVHERLLKVFTKIQLPVGITPLEIRLISPREQLITQFGLRKNRLDDGSDGALMEFRGITVGVWPIDAGFFYRLEDLSYQPGDIARVFDHRVRELVA